MEVGREVVLGSTRQVTNCVDGFGLDGRLRSTAERQQPVDEVGKSVLEDLLADGINSTELTKAGGNHGLDIHRRVLLNEVVDSVDDFHTTLLLEKTSEGQGDVGNGLKSNEHNTRMGYS